MKKNKTLMQVLIIGVFLSIITPVSADSAVDNNISISSNFDAENWSFGEYDWFEDMDVLLAQMNDFDEWTLRKLMSDLYIGRDIHVSEFGREFRMENVYSEIDGEIVLTQILLTADIVDETEYQAAIDSAEGIFMRMCEQSDDIDTDYNSKIFSKLRSEEENYEQAIWNSLKPITTYNEREMLGLVELSSELRDGIHRLQYKFGVITQKK